VKDPAQPDASDYVGRMVRYFPDRMNGVVPPIRLAP
jgi:hypothetical protein